MHGTNAFKTGASECSSLSPDMKLADIHVTPNYCNTLGLFFEVQVLLRISFMAVNYLTNPFLSYIKTKEKNHSVQQLHQSNS